MIRIDFPGYSGESSLERISWEEWFDAFDENDLAFLHQDETEDGQVSHFNKLVSSESVETRSKGGKGKKAPRPRAGS